MSFISKTRDSLRTIVRSKNFGEFFDNISWGMFEFAAFFTVLPFILTPLIQIISNVISYLQYDAPSDYFAYNISPVNRLAAIFGSITLALIIGKSIREKRSVKGFFCDEPPMAFFLILCLLMLVSTCINGFTEAALHGDDELHESLFNYLMYYLIYFFLSSRMTRKWLKAAIEYALIAGSFIMGVMVIFHVFVSPIRQFIHETNQDKLTAVFLNSNHYGYYLTIIILLSSSLFLLEKNKPLKVLCLLNFILNSVILVINNTLGSYIGCVIGLIFFIVVRYICTNRLSKGGIILLISFILTTAIVNFGYTALVASIFKTVEDIKHIANNDEYADRAGTNRWKIWRYSVSYILEKPVFGFGIEGTGERLLAVTRYSRAHNEFLQYATFFGIPALIAYVGGVLSVFLKGLKNKLSLDIYTTAALVATLGYLGSSFFGNSKFYIAPIFFVLLGIASASGKKAHS